ncbi:MAG: DUF5368 domain-containing protein [Rhodospirillaceae bacterium]
MNEFDLSVMLAVFQEMLGIWFWILPLLAAFGIGGATMVLLKEKKLDTKRLVRCQALGLFGGIAALVLMAWVTVSGFSDAGGPVDWLLVGIIWGVGWLGTTILAYAVTGLVTNRTPAQAAPAL